MHSTINVSNKNLEEGNQFVGKMLMVAATHGQQVSKHVVIGDNMTFHVLLLETAKELAKQEATEEVSELGGGWLFIKKDSHTVTVKGSSSDFGPVRDSASLKELLAADFPGYQIEVVSN